MLQFPSTPEEWLDIANQFGRKTNFWNCVGAIYGKHITIKKPASSGSTYYNYKGFFSIILLALVDANKKFIMVDVGTNGRISDGGVLFYSKFGELLYNNEINLPKPSRLPNSSGEYPFVFVGDEAFALRPNLMKPYPQANLNSATQEFNRRLSSARVVVENAFGILAMRLGVFQKAIALEPKKAELFTTACCYLHNFLATEAPCYTQLIEEIPDAPLVELKRSRYKNSISNAKEVRDNLCTYFNNQGKIN